MLISDKDILAACSAHLGAYTAATFPAFQCAAHHRVLIDALHDVESGECKRLIVCMPPRHGKSLLISQHFPAYYLGLHPDRQIIAATYAQDFADGWGRRVRNQLADAEFYGAIFPETRLRSDSRAASRFETTKGGVYVALGREGQATGRGAHLLLIDDPIKDSQEADSDAIRKQVREFYSATAYTRLMPGGAIVLVMTRWHEDDLAGWLMRDHAHEGWRVISMPAVAEDYDDMGRQPGDALWPEQFPRDVLDLTRRTFEAGGQARHWWSLYQQQPHAVEGAMFQPDRILIGHDVPPASAGNDVRAWDLAATAGGGDATVGVRVRRTLTGDLARFWITDVVRLRGAPHEVEEAIVTTAKRDGRAVTIRIPQDPGQAGKAQAAYLVSRLQGFRVVALPVSGDKATRAGPAASQVNVGNVSMVQAPWNAPLIAELRSFPAGREDDQVDALSDAFNALVSPPRPSRSLQIPFIGR